MNKKEIQKSNIIEALSETPFVAIACKRAGIARATYYRWLEEDEVFKEKALRAITQGNAAYNDIAKQRLMTLVQDGSLPAIKYWLSSRDPDFNPSLNRSERAESEIQPLTFLDAANKAQDMIEKSLKEQGLKEVFIPLDTDENAIGAVKDPFGLGN